MSARVLFIASILLCTVTANARDIILSNEPVNVKLPLSQEIRIEFPEMVIDLNVPAAADSHLETLLTPKGVLYWKATSLFDKNRAIATTAAGEVILLDLVSQTNPVSEEDTVLRLRSRDNPVTVSVQPENMAVDTAAQQVSGLPDFLARELDPEAGGTGDAQKPVYSYGDMAAFAFQHYVGPARLISDMPMTRVKAKPPKSNRFLRVWSDRVQLRVLNGWIMDNQYVTAVKVRNVSNQPLSFDPRAIRGKFLFVATLHETLAPRGSANDTTIWVFITERPFNEAAGG